MRAGRDMGGSIDGDHGTDGEGVRAVLFDMFGVIARHQSAEGKERLREVSGLPADAFWGAYWNLRQPYDRGDLSGPEYWRRVASALGATFTARQTADLVEADLASWSAVDDEMVALVEGLAESGRRVALLSNIPEELAAFYEERHGWLKHFQPLGFSCRIGHAKPEPGAYAWCRAALGLEADRILFVDDREENVRAAEAQGFRGHHFTTSARLRPVLGL